MAETPLSIVMPVLNEARTLERYLPALQAWREYAELIVVDGGSADASVDIASPLCDICLVADRGRARQMNAGAAVAAGGIVLFLHCDTRLQLAPADFPTQLPGAARWGFFRVRLSGAARHFRLIESAMNWRSRLTRVATGDQCLFVERALWRALGGYADIPLMEDVELCKRLRRCGPPHIVGAPAVTSSRRWEDRGALKTVLDMSRLRLAYWLGAEPADLARRYYG